MHDNDGKYSEPFLEAFKNAKIKTHRTAIRSPNTVAYVERIVQTLAHYSRHASDHSKTLWSAAFRISTIFQDRKTADRTFCTGRGLNQSVEIDRCELPIFGPWSHRETCWVPYLVVSATPLVAATEPYTPNQDQAANTPTGIGERLRTGTVSFEVT
jgi:hypothetical protein